MSSSAVVGAPGSPARGGRRWLVRGLAAALAAALLALAPWLWVQAASRGRLVDAAEAPHGAVALVLGAGLAPDGTPSPFLASRLEVAKQLLDEGSVDAILVSGDNRTHDYDEPTAMRDHLVALGVPSDRVAMDFGGRDTYDSCLRARDVFGVDEALVVSQAWHATRAVAICRALGVDAVGVGETRTAQLYPGPTRAGRLREVVAAAKAAGDVLSRRAPGVGGPPESSVADILERTGAR